MNEGKSRNLVIVESPTKARTIQRFLGEEFTVKSSFGHIRDLQDNKLSVDVEHGFAPQYVIPADKRKVVADLKKLSAGATVWLASDEDREGEAISWHLAQALDLGVEDTRRIVFHEITEQAIRNAIQNPRTIDMNLVNAQKARRVLDRLVGFELSPVLWRKIQPKLSAGRVQSVALRLVVDREREILSFQNEPYYSTTAVFHPAGAAARVKVNATLDTRFKDIAEARKYLEDSIGAEFKVDSLEKKEGLRAPAPPFTTSTLQQEASRKLHFSVSTTMRIAQQLYERGLITYMRTDSTNLSSLALGSAKKYITENFGEDYSHPRQFHTRSKGAQEAHEAIRPTFIGNTDVEGTAQEKKLYSLIWKRTVASQMADARMMNTSIKVASAGRSEKFNVQAAQVLFDGFLKVYMESQDDPEEENGNAILPELRVGDVMEVAGMQSDCKFTQAPARYSEATLVHKLEELGIGRPSTYSPTITTLTTGRGYIVKGDKEGRAIPVRNLKVKDGAVVETDGKETVGAEKGKFLPQEIGIIVTDFLVKNFPSIVDYDFTAKVESDFDRIAAGKKEWTSLLSDFYREFHNVIEDTLSDKNYNHVERVLGTDPEGNVVIAKFGQFGPFVQKGDGENRMYASLGKGQLIESITLADALELFRLPRTVGQWEGNDVIATKGKFGPYVRCRDLNASIPKGKDPMTITLEECIGLLEKRKEGAAENAVLKEFKDSGIQVIDGRYGPYIKQGTSNFRIPKGTDVQTLDEAACKNIIDNSKPTRKTFRRFKKG